MELCNSTLRLEAAQGAQPITWWEHTLTKPESLRILLQQVDFPKQRSRSPPGLDQAAWLSHLYCFDVFNIVELFFLERRRDLQFDRKVLAASRQQARLSAIPT